MNEHAEVHKLVIMTLDCAGSSMKAVQIYSEIQRAPEKAAVLRAECIYNVRSLSKVIQMFPEIAAQGSNTKEYFLKGKV
jgi:hypothetical protein